MSERSDSTPWSQTAPSRNDVLEEARSWASAMYEDTRKDRYDITFKQGWEAASEAIEEKFRALKNADPQVSSVSQIPEQSGARPAESAPLTEEESAWLIESVGGRWGTGYFWRGVDDGSAWGTIERAVRFARKEDADQVIESMYLDDKRKYRGRYDEKYEACEHIWIGYSSSPSPLAAHLSEEILSLARRYGSEDAMPYPDSEQVEWDRWNLSAAILRLDALAKGEK